MNKFADMSKEQFDALVQAEVEKQLSSREEAQARLEAEEALQEAKKIFETLKASLEAKDTKIKEYEEMLANLDLDPTAAEVAANEKVVALETSLEDWKRRAEVAEAALIMLEKDETAANRMADLEQGGVALDDEDAEAQYAKVREMSDEEFDAYKRELIALRSKYASASEGAEKNETDLEGLTDDQISEIANTVGCDPKDSKCLDLVKSVANKMAEVSRARRKPADHAANKGKDAASDSKTEEPKKENASSKDKLSLGDAISKALDREIHAPSSLTEEISHAWVGYLAEKRGEKKTE